ncbi:hypothetical protein ACGYK1_18945, partial [Sulfitobacter sp. 1A13191]
LASLCEGSAQPALPVGVTPTVGTLLSKGIFAMPTDTHRMTARCIQLLETMAITARISEKSKETLLIG